MRPAAFLTALALCWAGPAVAQVGTLADIRQELSALYSEILKLQRELSPSGSSEPVVGGDVLQRVDTIEGEMRRLTASTERLEFRISRVVEDGTNRIGDLEFRLCELEADCDIASLGGTPSLGGEVADATPVDPVPEVERPQLAIGEQADFDRARQALERDDFLVAADLFQGFTETYTDSPFAGEAHFLRGEAYSGAGETSLAARAYLESFSGEPGGHRASDALFRLGESLAGLGQTEEACLMFGQVGVRFPESQHVAVADAEFLRLGCP
ncbi:MAG: tol-pal system protein YbgF [Rhodobacter sp.]|nr:tol-pal system protein YbgF [Rhodobacter sp.]MCY4169714.1 tol-pal system protein YbgF [Rhodobacter sp.]MCY4240641.1 tol-pal system protein YbgF [Rhodobacter sp.]